MTRCGRIYGKGAKGLVMDTKCDVTDNETLCKKLESPQIDTLTLYGFDAKREITSRDDITKFKDQVLSIDNLVIKYFFKRDSKADFMNEVNSIKKVKNIQLRSF